MPSVIYSPKADKQFSKLESDIQDRIDQAVRNKLEIDPNHHLKPLTGQYNDYYRFRVGYYRLLCKIEVDNTILVEEIKHRGKAYRKNKKR